MDYFTPNRWIKALETNKFWEKKTLYKVMFTRDTNRKAYVEYTFGEKSYRNSAGYANDPSIWEEVFI